MKFKKLISMTAALIIASGTYGSITCSADVYRNGDCSVAAYSYIYKTYKGSSRTLNSQLDGVKLMSTGNVTPGADPSQSGNTGTGATAADYASIDISGDQLKYLANTVMHEIGYYPDKDRTANDPTQTPISNVVSVILNRVVCQNNDFKNVNTIYDVVSQPGQFSGIKPYLNLSLYSDYANQDVYDAIKYVLANGDTTGGALYFHSGAPKGFFAGGTITFLFKDYAGHSFYKPRS